jgi:hypothetical protein
VRVFTTMETLKSYDTSLEMVKGQMQNHFRQQGVMATVAELEEELKTYSSAMIASLTAILGTSSIAPAKDTEMLGQIQSLASCSGIVVDFFKEVEGREVLISIFATCISLVSSCSSYP